MANGHRQMSGPNGVRYTGVRAADQCRVWYRATRCATARRLAAALVRLVVVVVVVVEEEPLLALPPEPAASSSCLDGIMSCIWSCLANAASARTWRCRLESAEDEDEEEEAASVPVIDKLAGGITPVTTADNLRLWLPEAPPPPLLPPPLLRSSPAAGGRALRQFAGAVSASLLPRSCCCCCCPLIMSAAVDPLDLLGSSSFFLFSALDASFLASISAGNSSCTVFHSTTFTGQLLHVSPLQFIYIANSHIR